MKLVLKRVRILKGDYKGLVGEGFFWPNQNCYRVSIPNRKRPKISEFYPPEDLQILGEAERPILEEKEFTTLQTEKDHVQIIGCKVSCSSVWCKECFVRKGGSKRIANRLAELDYQSTRHVVLTADKKKFSGASQCAYETLRDREALSQFIHNLKRTAKIKIVDWVWILEWHTDGAPHWHMFIQTEKGKKGQIGNEALLKHWKHGLVFESYIKSKKHWSRFTSYFGANGYFDPHSGCESKDKSHQLELPEWAKKVTYKIRKTSSMNKKDRVKNISKEIEKKEIGDDFIEDQKENTSKNDPKTYQEILDSCGQSTLCQIRRGDSYLIWKKIPIAYQYFKEYPGYYKEHTGYILQMDLNAFFLFLGLNDYQTRELERQFKIAA